MEFPLKDIETKIKIGSGVAFNAKNLLTQHGFDLGETLFVSDEKIWQNCARFFADDFLENFSDILILKNPKADEETLEKISEALSNAQTLVCLGSGVINDLCKFASFKSQKPYAIFASAPSMNGYLSKNSSLTFGGHKKTLATTLPEALFVDLVILKNAPKDLIKAGIGDSMCFFSCWFDQLLAQLLLGREFNADAMSLLVDQMVFFTQNYQNYSLFDDELLEILITILLLSGASMTLAGSSAPASQSEHLIAHAFTMKYPEREILHGLQVATTTITSAQIQEELLSQNEIYLRDANFDKTEMTRFFGAEISRQSFEEYNLKLRDIRANQRFLAQELQENWPQYCQILSKVFLSAENLRAIFDHFGIKTGHDALGLTREEYRDLIGRARFIRNRFTCLDL